MLQSNWADFEHGGLIKFLYSSGARIKVAAGTETVYPLLPISSGREVPGKLRCAMVCSCAKQN